MVAPAGKDAHGTQTRDAYRTRARLQHSSSVIKMMQLISGATDLKTLLADLMEGKIITAFQNNPHIKELQYGMLDLQKFAKEQNRKNVKYWLDCSWTHNLKTKPKSNDMLHSFFILPKELGTRDHRMERCNLRKKFRRKQTEYAILDTVVQEIVDGRRSGFPDALMQQPILLIRTQWMKKIAKKYKVKLPVQYNVPSTAVEL